MALARLERKTVTLEEASRENPAIVRAASPNPLRERAMILVREGCFNEAAGLLPTAVPPKKSRLLRRRVSFLKRRLGGK